MLLGKLSLSFGALSLDSLLASVLSRREREPDDSESQRDYEQLQQVP
jgi:hypothetical protein